MNESLYELSEQYKEILYMLNDPEEDEQVILDSLESLDFDIEQKAENYGKIIRILESNAKAVKEEKERLLEREKHLENKIKWLKNNMKNCMYNMGKKRIDTDLFSFSICKAGGKRKLTMDVPIDKVPEEFRIKQPDLADNDKLRDYLKKHGMEGDDGSVNCEWCHLEPQTEYLRMK